MKKWMIMMLMGLSVSGNLVKAESVYEQTEETPFAINFQQLGKYLQLETTQMEPVYQINEAFRANQEEAQTRGAKRKGELMKQALLVNLKQMKEVLSEAQYRDYVAILNVTNNHNRLLSNRLTDIYLAEKLGEILLSCRDAGHVNVQHSVFLRGATPSQRTVSVERRTSKRPRANAPADTSRAARHRPFGMT